MHLIFLYRRSSVICMSFYTVFNLRNLLYIIPAAHLSLPGAIYSGLSYQILKIEIAA